jgi:predicted PurR-regulated permease PerM
MTKPVRSTLVLGLLLLAFTALLVYVLAPFWQQLVLGLILALALQPVYGRIHLRIPSRYLASLATLLLLLLLAGIPFLLLVAIAGRDAFHAANELQRRAAQEGGIVVALGNWYATLMQWLEHALHLPIGLTSSFDPRAALSSRINELSTMLFSLSAGLLSGLAGFVGNLLLVLFSAFFLLADGADAIRILTRITPLPTPLTERLLKRIYLTTVANVKAMFVVGAVQGFLVGIGFAIAGLTSPLLFGLAAAVCSIVPVVGASIVWVPAAIFLFLDGHPGLGIFLLLWGVLAVVGIEQMLRPIVVGNSVKVHPLLLVLVIFGGVFVFGFIGLFLGPVILAVFTELLSLWQAQLPPTTPEP